MASVRPRRLDAVVDESAVQHPDPPMAAAEQRTRRRAHAAHAGFLLVAAVVVLRANASQWFTYDEWDFLAQRGVRGADLGLFSPHSEHWSTVPILIYRALYCLFGLHSYVPYVVVLVAFHLAAAHLLYRLLLRCEVAAWVAVFVVAVFGVLGAGSQNLLWAFQIGFVGSVTFGLAHLLAWTREEVTPWAYAGGLLLGAASLLSSGVGVPMVALAGGALALRKGVTRGALAVAPLAALYVVWLAGPGRSGLGSHGVTSDAVLLVPRFVVHGLTAAIESVTGMPGGGGPVALALAAFLAFRRVPLRSGPAGIVVACALAAVAVLAVAGVGRAGLGLEVAAAPRYSYIVLALLAPAVGSALSTLVGGRRGATAAVAAVLVAVGVHNVDLLRTAAAESAGGEQAGRRQVAAAAELVRSGAPLLDARPDPERAPNLYLPALVRMVEEGRVPGGVRLTMADRLAASTQLQLGLYGTPPPPPATSPLQLSAVTDVTTATAAAGCQVLTPAGPNPTAVVDVPSPGSVRMRSTAGGALTVLLHDDASGDTGPLRRLELPPGHEQWLAVTRGGTKVIVRLPGAPTEVCTGP